MGHRISISFSNKKIKTLDRPNLTIDKNAVEPKINTLDMNLDISPILYDQWRGLDSNLALTAKNFLIELYKRTKDKVAMPIDRKEPDVVMFHFIHKCTIIEDSARLMTWHWMPDSSDAGHYNFVLGKTDFKIEHFKGGYQSEIVITR